MSKLNKLHVVIGVLAAMSFLLVASWAQWGSVMVPTGPGDYLEVIAVIKWSCVLLCLGTAYLTQLAVPQRT